VSLSIRPEAGDDAEAIRAVLLDAFPTAAEADLVERLRQDLDSEISLVAQESGRIVGHILLSRMRVEGDGRAFRALGLAPVAVLRQRQRRGIGGRLIERALAIARDKGEEIVFVVGEPDYYCRFGFSAATAAPFASPYAGPYLMARTLADVALPAAGAADYAPAFAEFGS